jgi:hypothetical protein
MISRPAGGWNKSLHALKAEAAALKSAGARQQAESPKNPPAKENGLASFEANPLIQLARLAGFEPTTPWFVASGALLSA